jgi:hypothetical protein
MRALISTTALATPVQDRTPSHQTALPILWDTGQHGIGSPQIGEFTSPPPPLRVAPISLLAAEIIATRFIARFGTNIISRSYISNIIIDASAAAYDLFTLLSHLILYFASILLTHVAAEILDRLIFISLRLISRSSTSYYHTPLRRGEPRYICSQLQLLHEFLSGYAPR